VVNEEHEILVFLDCRPSFVLPGVSEDVFYTLFYLCVGFRVVIIFCDGSAVLFM
jgi:hypothetical protein